MSALGQKKTCALHQPMSAFPPQADIEALNLGTAIQSFDVAAIAPLAAEQRREIGNCLDDC
ncbi:MAG: hypothetical protein WBX78_01265, partial [Pseudolabrys sp.]